MMRSVGGWRGHDDPELEDDRPEEQAGEIDDVGRKLLRNRVILLTGEIDTKLSTHVVGQLLFLEAEGDEPIRVLIDSPGGDVNAAFAIFDTIRFVRPAVYTIGLGLVASAGAFILLAAKREHRVGLANSHYMLHQPLSGMSGVASDIEIHARESEKVRRQINTIVAKECRKTMAQVERDTDRDFWLNAAEATEYGLIDATVRSSAELDRRMYKGSKAGGGKAKVAAPKAEGGKAKAGATAPKAGERKQKAE